MIFSPPSVSIIQLYPNPWCFAQLIEFGIFGFSKWDFVFICFKVFNILSFKIAFADTVKEQQTRKKFFFTNQSLVSRQINGYKSSPLFKPQIPTVNHSKSDLKNISVQREWLCPRLRNNLKHSSLLLLWGIGGGDGLGDRFEIYLAEWLNDDEIYRKIQKPLCH